MSAKVIAGMERRFKDYNPDYLPKDVVPLPGKRKGI